MSTAVTEKKAGPRLTLTRSKNGGAVAPKSNDALSIGGAPRVHLLPPEVQGRKKSKQLRRRLGFGLVGVAIVVAGGVALATVSLLAAQASMVSAQNRASDLAAQQAKYGAVTKIQLDSAAIKAAQISATAKEIAWAPYIAQLQKTLSPGMSITAFDASIDATAQAANTGPLEGPRIATLKVTVASPQASISDWLNKLPTLTGFVDETPGSVTSDDNSYKVDVVIHISDAALANRFAPKK